MFCNSQIRQLFVFLDKRYNQTCFYNRKYCLSLHSKKQETKPTLNNKNTENSMEGDHQSLINILLQNPEDFNLKQKPSGIRENKMFTLDMIEIPRSSAKADDNGAYISKGSVTKFYVYNENGSRTSHKDGNGVWYVNVRGSRGYRK